MWLKRPQLPVSTSFAAARYRRSRRAHMARSRIVGGEQAPVVVLRAQDYDDVQGVRA
ncbi:MAG: hypothetical protein AB1505_12170 [Candidatus Latescibacterota bacterium]